MSSSYELNWPKKYNKKLLSNNTFDNIAIPTFVVCLDIPTVEVIHAIFENVFRVRLKNTNIKKCSNEFNLMKKILFLVKGVKGLMNQSPTLVNVFKI